MVRSVCQSLTVPAVSQQNVKRFGESALVTFASIPASSRVRQGLPLRPIGLFGGIAVFILRAARQRCTCRTVGSAVQLAGRTVRWAAPLRWIGEQTTQAGGCSPALLPGHRMSHTRGSAPARRAAVVRWQRHESTTRFRVHYASAARGRFRLALEDWSCCAPVLLVMKQSQVRDDRCLCVGC